MCGIFGLIDKNGGVKPAALENAAGVLKHRGPDSRNYWINSQKTVGLGHARLSIIDIEGGTQPLHNEDRTIYAVVNGEIYDFERIREDLKIKGHVFLTASDSELVIHLYEEYGLDSVKEMRGEFAFILWDEKLQLLFAGRDRFGIKPVYYSQKNGKLFIASEIKAILAAGLQPYWDIESLYISSFMGFIPLQNRTFFRDIYQIPPGCILTYGNGGLKIDKYWDFNYPTMEEHQEISEAEAVESFRSIFEESVKLRLRADVPVGVYLSGGIDSCSILGTVAKIKGPGTRAFTISFDDAVYDEFSVAREMAELTGTELNCYNMTSALLVNNFTKSIYHGETIMANLHSVAKFILSKHVRDAGYKVVLTGEGSDEIFAGYAHFRQDMLLHDPVYGENSKMIPALSRLNNNNPASRGLLIANRIKKQDNTITDTLGFFPAWLMPFMRGAIKGSTYFNKKNFSKFENIDPYGALLSGIDVENELRGRHVLNQSLYLWSKLILPNYLLSNLGDRMEMGHSIEGRVPFLDHKLVEFVTGLPVYYKIRRNLQEKYLLREALKPVLTKTVYERQKHPFLAPPIAGDKKNPVFRFMSDYICDNLKGLPFFNQRKVKTLIRLMPFMPAGRRRLLDPAIVIVASMIAMNENFGISAG